MNRYILVLFYFFSLNSLAQDNSMFQFDLFNLNNSSSFFNSDTVLGIPFFSDHELQFMTKNSLNEFFVFDENNLIIDFSDFIDSRNNLSSKFFAENNLLYFGFPKGESYYSFGFKYSSYFDLNISNELINLFWNGNSQYADDIVSFKNNSSSLLQFSSLFFQYSSNLFKDFRFGARVSLLHGVNFFNLDRGNFSLQSFFQSTTPFASLINTDILYQSSNASIFGFSNPGLAINLGFEYILNKLKFSVDIQNLGFIFWHKNSSQNQSEGTHFFDGVHYTMNQIFSEEINSSLDTLEDIFALKRTSSNSFFSKIPMRINLNTTYIYIPSTSFFIDYYALQNNTSGYTHNAFFGISKLFRQRTILKTAYGLNNYSFYNIQFSISRKFKDLLINFNTNNLLSIFNLRETNYLSFQSGIYYFF